MSDTITGCQPVEDLSHAWDIFPLLVLALSFALHHQMVSLIIKEEGRNVCLHEKGDLHFGCRKRYMVNKDGGGVICVPTDNNLKEENI